MKGLSVEFSTDLYRHTKKLNCPLVCFSVAYLVYVEWMDFFAACRNLGSITA